jgi:type VI secretion system secreted protein VgrG
MPIDIEKAAKKITAIKAAGSTGKCARHVRLALEAGGFDMSGSPLSAKDYGAYLTNQSFAEAVEKGYEPKQGDVVVIQPYKGGSTHGHIALFDGANWVSDFQQRDMWGGPGYRNNKPGFKIYRYSPVVAPGIVLP